MFLEGIALENFIQRKRLVAPFAGFPSINLGKHSLKQCQENAKYHSQVIRRLSDTLKPDILFPMMDLSLEVGALNFQVDYQDNEPAFVPNTKFHLDELQTLNDVDIFKSQRLNNYIETIHKLNRCSGDSKMLGAYITGPFTLAALILDFETTKAAINQRREDFHKLLEFTMHNQLKIAKELVNSGANVICIVEPTAVFLGEDKYFEFSGSYVKKMAKCIHSLLADCILHICGDTMHMVREMSRTDVDVLSVDSPDEGVDLLTIASTIQEGIIYQGNINPTGTILTGTPENVYQETRDLMVLMQNVPNFILGTGCDLPKDVPIENLQAFMKAGREPF